MKKLICKLLNSLYTDENNCIVCDRELTTKNRYGLCPECDKNLPRNNGKVCVKCGKPIYDEAEYCIVCNNNTRYFDRVCSPLIYKDSIEKLVLNYKFYNKRFLHKYLVSFLIDEYLDKAFNADIIIPVPMTEKGRKERGFSQTELLAKALSERLNIAYLADGVIKTKDTEHQAKLSGQMRAKNVQGVFKLNADVKGKRVLIIDDILTTGATISEVARAVLRGKPLSVEGLTLSNAEYRPYSE